MLLNIRSLLKENKNNIWHVNVRGPHGPNQGDIGSGSSAVEFSTVRRKPDESPRSAVGDLAGLVKPRGMAK